MMGLETMLANLLGVKPEEMKAMFITLVDTANNANDKMNKIESQQAEILQLLKGKENGDGKDDN